MKKLLVVDDNQINRKVLCNILADKYETVEAENGKAALEILMREKENISLVLLDIVMPVMDGYTFLKEKQKNETIAAIPVIITTEKDGEQEEEKGLASGATDFVGKPYKPKIIRHRITNIINLREKAAILNLLKRDRLTGLLSKEFFYQKTDQLLRENPKDEFDLICCDIENFKLVNDIFGAKTGDEILKKFGQLLEDGSKGLGLCGRLSGDTFAIFLYHVEHYTNEMFASINQKLNRLVPNMNLMVRFGVFEFANQSISANVMCDRALLAADGIKGHYGEYFTYYDDKLREKLIQEQFIRDHMAEAIRQEEFKIYFQPKCNLKTGKVSGAEALVRWENPEKGLMSPGEFIPFFEESGFITEMDYYVWEKTCKQIKAWKEQGYGVVPISVNVSRLDIYNPELPNILGNLLETYQLDPEILHLEITETAYTEDPRQLIECVTGLKKMGFIIEMDDFGQGYSS
ncbi:MAG: EAL domain-containing protein, partial [Anaerovoracaceae bacterium]